MTDENKSEDIACKSFKLDSYNNYSITHLLPTIDKPFDLESETFLHSTYYGSGMSPTLCPGDRLLFKKVDGYMEDSEIYMIQWCQEDQIVIGRMRPCKSKDHMYISYDNLDGLNGEMGQLITKKYIIGVWQLISSTKIHCQIPHKMRLPIFSI